MVDFPTSKPLPSRQLAILAKEIADLEGDLGKLVKRGKVADELLGTLRRRIFELVGTMRETLPSLESAASYFATVDGAEAADQKKALDAAAETLRMDIATAANVTVAGTPFQ